MSLPDAIREYGFIGGLIIGAAWAFDRLLSRRNDKRSPEQQRLVTPQDVLAELQSFRAQVEARQARDDERFGAWHRADVAMHEQLETDLKEIRGMIRRLGDGGDE